MSAKLGISDTTGTLGRRDAIHCPCVLVNCMQSLRPGDSVKFIGDRYTTVELCLPHERHGIIDPFIKEAYIKERTSVWMLIQPELVGDTLTHQFDIKLGNVTGIVANIYTPEQYDKMMVSKLAQEVDTETLRCEREDC